MRTPVETCLAWLSLAWALLYGVGENWVAISKGFPAIAFADEWVAISLLVFAAWRSLRTKVGAPGVLSTAWAFAFCLVLRQYQGRVVQSNLDAVGQWELSILQWLLPLLGVVFAISLWLASREPTGPVSDRLSASRP